MGVDPSEPTVADLVALARLVQEHCLTAGITVATAESCTGGLIGHALTEVAGCSGYFEGGVISYSDAVKASALEVPAATLERHGAVSAQVAVAMAEGARRALRTSVGVAVTGIAGPAGGSEAKPVGLTYVAVADEAGHDLRRHQWTGDRTANKLASARAALTLLVERLGARDATANGNATQTDDRGGEPA